VKTRSRGLRIGLLVLGCTALYAAALIAGSSQKTNEGTGSTAQTYKGLSIAAKSLERAKNVSLRDCPPGANTVRGVIRPTEDNEFVTVEIDVNVLSSFQPVELPKPVLYDASGEAYKTAQSFGEMNAQPSYSCKFSFRVPTGRKASRFAIGDASFDLAALEK
jgi:hypothetical protein